MLHRRGHPSLRDLRVALDARPSALPGVLEHAHAADVAEWLPELEEGVAQQVFGLLDTGRRGEVLEYADDELRAQLLRGMEAAELTELVEALPPDEAVDLLALADDQLSEDVLRAVDDESERELRELSAYGEETAGGIMTSDFDAFPGETKVGDVIKALRKDEEAEEDEASGVYIVDARDRPVGFLSDRELLTTPIHTPLAEVMEADPITVGVHDDQEEVALVLAKYGLPSVAVVDDAGLLVGVVTADDALDVLGEEAEEDFRKLVGTGGADQTRLPVAKRVRQRLPLMGLTVIGGLFTAWILERFLPGTEGEVSNADVLRYLPIIIGLAGNVGIQSSTILVRGIATGEVEGGRELRVLRSEVLTGASIGLLCGAATAVVAPAIEAGSAGAPWAFGAAVGVAIAITVAWAAVLGTLVPLGCRRLAVDPAVAAGPILITVIDVSGSGIFMLIARALLGLGGGGA